MFHITIDHAKEAMETSVKVVEDPFLTKANICFCVLIQHEFFSCQKRTRDTHFMYAINTFSICDALCCNISLIHPACIQ